MGFVIGRLVVILGERGVWGAEFLNLVDWVLSGRRFGGGVEGNC